MEFIMGNKEEKNEIFKGSREHSTPFGSSLSLESLVTDFNHSFTKIKSSEIKRSIDFDCPVIFV